MDKICWLEIGKFEVGSRQVRNFIKRHRKSKFRNQEIDINYAIMPWSDILEKKEGYNNFLEKNKNNKIIVRYRAPEKKFHMSSKNETGQDKYLPGEKYVEFFAESITAIDEILKENFDIEFVNSAKGLATARNKYKTLQILKENGIPIPKTYSIDSVNELEELLEKYGNIFMKPPGGSQGRGCTQVSKTTGEIDGSTTDTYWINTKYKIENGIISEEETKTLHTTKKQEFRENISKILEVSSMVQPTITVPPLEDSYGNQLKWDVRVVTVFPEYYPKIISAVIRAVPYSEIVTNLSTGGQAHNLEKLFIKDDDLKRDFDLGERGIEKLRNSSIKTAELLELNEAGTDFLISKDDLDPRVIETNAMPGYRSGYYSGINIGDYVVCGMLQHMGYEDPLLGLKYTTFEDEEAISKILEENAIVETVV